MGEGYDHRKVRRVSASVAGGTTDGLIWQADDGQSVRVLALYAAPADLSGGGATLALNSKPAGSAGSARTQTFAAPEAGWPTLDWQHCHEGWLETLPGEGLSVTTGAGPATNIQAVLVIQQASSSGLLAAEDDGLLLTEWGEPLATEN